MSVIDAYIKEYGYLNIVLTSVDHKLLKEVAANLSKDFGSEVIDLFPITENLYDIDSNRAKELMEIENPIKIIISPIFPTSKTSYEPNSYMNEITKKKLPYHMKIHDITGGSNYKATITNSTRIPLDFSRGQLKVKASLHINLSLNKKMIEDREILSKLVDQEFVYKNFSRVNKYINVSKYSNNTKLEDDIFNYIIEKVQKKLEKGKYMERIKNIQTESTIESTTELNTDDSNTESEFTEKLISKKYDHDKKEEYLEKKNRLLDKDIMDDIDIQDDIIDPLDNINYINDVELEDINLDNEPTLDSTQGKMIVGTRKINKKFATVGKRILKKKMK